MTFYFDGGPLDGERRTYSPLAMMRGDWLVIDGHVYAYQGRPTIRFLFSRP